MRAIAGIVILVVSVQLADWVQSFTGLSVSGSVLVMIFSLCLMCLWGRVPVFLESGAAALFRVFPLLFVPALVMVVQEKEMISSHLWVLLFAITISSLLGVVASVSCYKLLARQYPRKKQGQG